MSPAIRLPGGPVPSWDVTINYIPIPYPALTPAVIDMAPNEKQFWRVANASADTILDLQVVYDGKPQPIQLVALDGVPLGSQDGTAQGKLITVTDLRLPPAARMEFIVTGPSATVKSAQFMTLAINTGPDGDNDTRRVIANIEPVGDNSGQDARRQRQGVEAMAPAIRRIGRSAGYGDAHSVLFRECGSDAIFHNRRRSDAGGFLARQSSRYRDDAGLGRGLDDPEPRAGESRIPHPPDPFHGDVAG